MPENCVVAAIEMSSHSLAITTSGLHMPSREVSTRVTGLTAHENMDIPVRCFNHFHRKSVYLSKRGTITSISW